MEIYKIYSWYGKLMSGDGLSAKCPICGVISNMYPDYSNGSGTTINHNLTYCGHKAEGYFEIGEKL